MQLQQNHLESASQVQYALEKAAIKSAVIGGLAIAIWGEPRVTKDVDLRVLLQRDQAFRLLSAFPPDLKILSDSPEEKLRQAGFVFTENNCGVRIDFLLAENAFDIQTVERSHRIEPIPGWPISVCTA